MKKNKKEEKILEIEDWKLKIEDSGGRCFKGKEENRPRRGEKGRKNIFNMCNTGTEIMYRFPPPRSSLVADMHKASPYAQTQFSIFNFQLSCQIFLQIFS